MLDVLYLSHIGHRNSPVFSIGESQLAHLEDAFACLREKTGVWIDAYGNCRVYVDHQKILVEHLRLSDDPAVQAFVAFLRCAIDENEPLLFVGD